MSESKLDMDPSALFVRQGSVEIDTKLPAAKTTQDMIMLCHESISKLGIKDCQLFLDLFKYIGKHKFFANFHDNSTVYHPDSPWIAKLGIRERIKDLDLQIKELRDNLNRLPTLESDLDDFHDELPYDFQEEIDKLTADISEMGEDVKTERETKQNRIAELNRQIEEATVNRIAAVEAKKEERMPLEAKLIAKEEEKKSLVEELDKNRREIHDLIIGMEPFLKAIKQKGFAALGKESGADGVRYIRTKSDGTKEKIYMTDLNELGSGVFNHILKCKYSKNEKVATTGGIDGTLRMGKNNRKIISYREDETRDEMIAREKNNILFYGEVMENFLHALLFLYRSRVLQYSSGLINSINHIGVIRNNDEDKSVKFTSLGDLLEGDLNSLYARVKSDPEKSKILERDLLIFLKQVTCFYQSLQHMGITFNHNDTHIGNILYQTQKEGEEVVGYNFYLTDFGMSSLNFVHEGEPYLILPLMGFYNYLGFWDNVPSEKKPMGSLMGYLIPDGISDLYSLHTSLMGIAGVFDRVPLYPHTPFGSSEDEPEFDASGKLKLYPFREAIGKNMLKNTAVQLYGTAKLYDRVVVAPTQIYNSGNKLIVKEYQIIRAQVFPDYQSMINKWDEMGSSIGIPLPPCNVLVPVIGESSSSSPNVYVPGLDTTYDAKGGNQPHRYKIKYIK